MPLVACKSCREVISRNTSTCPQCGAPPPEVTATAAWLLAALLAGAGVLGVVSQLGSSKQPDNDRTRHVQTSGVLKSAWD
jgi:hypothetical protein